MSEVSNATLGLSRALLKLGRVLNIVFATAFFVLLVLSFFNEQAFHDYYRTHIPKADVARLLPALRAMVIVGAPMFALTHVILTRLLEMIETVRQGDPFVPENAARLRTVAWSLLIIQLLGFGFAVLALQVRSANVDMEFNNSLAGWLAVLLTFVLAGVFEHGARLRSDLQAMI